MKTSNRWKRVVKTVIVVLVLLCVWWGKRSYDTRTASEQLAVLKAELRSDGYQISWEDGSLRYSTNFSPAWIKLRELGSSITEQVRSLDRLLTKKVVELDRVSSLQVWISAHESPGESAVDLSRQISRALDEAAVIIDTREGYTYPAGREVWFVAGDDGETLVDGFMLRAQISALSGDGEQLWKDVHTLMRMFPASDEEYLVARTPFGTVGRLRDVVWNAVYCGADFGIEHLAAVRDSLGRIDFLKSLPDAYVGPLLDIGPWMESFAATYNAAESWVFPTDHWDLKMPFYDKVEASFAQMMERLWWKHYSAGPDVHSDEVKLLSYYRDQIVFWRDAVRDREKLPSIWLDAVGRGFDAPRLSFASPFEGDNDLSRTLRSIVDAERMRRLLINGLSLEMFRIKHGSLPQSLSEVDGVVDDPFVESAIRYEVFQNGEFSLASGQLVWPRLSAVIAKWKRAEFSAEQRRTRFEAYYGEAIDGGKK